MKYSTSWCLGLSTLLSTSASAQWASTTTYTFSGNTLPTGLIASSDLIRDTADTSSTATYNHQFNTSNVQISDNFLHLIVPGNQTTSPIQCAEVSTQISNILYASVRTSAILTNESGICNGMFFYHSDSQEIDIEWISDPDSASNNGTRVMQYTNQGQHGTEDAVEINGLAPDDATTEVHEYRVDWVEGKSRFFVDGEFQQEIEMNVPTTEGQWVWNAWTNGDPSFTVGPPENDAVFKIQKIVMIYNTTDDAGQQEGSRSGSGQARPVLFGLVVAVISLALMLC
ncbi:hypothetical protein CKM354_001059800 [Cercospora kikuchii]|uniref:GH16 domain-containing protein n=1 Tax=Cercospora kikuchii TaxID=84275 RepID=A0A9P3CRB2_9PEZI|nr:uncharacterized protein CKM354_001059800 [Cercospora kikuchii]GIZ47509.1 hypothetical protein CKM354_001059800 [Cercospora kikuchii]